MGSFVALDLETANSNYASICEVGLTKFENGGPVASWSSYIAPPDNLFYWD